MVLNSLFVEFSNQVSLESFIRVEIDYRWHLEWVHFEMLQQLWVASCVHPWVVYWLHSGAGVKTREDLNMLVEVIKLIVYLSHCWEKANGASLPVREASCLKFIFGSDFSEVSWLGNFLLSRICELVQFSKSMSYSLQKLGEWDITINVWLVDVAFCKIWVKNWNDTNIWKHFFLKALKHF